MVKINELMINDLVLAGKNTQFPMQVVGLFKDVAYLDFEGNEADMWEENETDIMPMPLTKEILINNGFEEKEDKISKYYISQDNKVFIRFQKNASVYIFLSEAQERIGAKTKSNTYMNCKTCSQSQILTSILKSELNEQDKM